MDQNEAQAIREVIEEALAPREQCYSGSFAFSIRFEADDTSAVRDTSNFQDILQLLGHRKAKEFVLKKDDRMPAYTVGSILVELDKLVSKIEGRTLVIGHYAGHSAVENGKLLFFASPAAPRSFGLGQALGPLYEDNTSTNPAFEKTDVVLILDSCYSGQAVGGLGPGTRSVEIIASVAADRRALENAPNLSRVQTRTFTSRLVDSVARHTGRGDSSSVSFAEIIRELRSESNSQTLPEYRLQVGRVGIRVPILGKPNLPPHLRALSGRRDTPSSSSASDQSAQIPATPTPQLNVVFAIHLDNVDALSGEMEKLVEWIQALQPAIGLELTGVYQSRSTFITLSAPWRLWAQLSGLRCVTLVGESFGPNMLPRLLRQQQPATRKENEPAEGTYWPGLEELKE